MSSEMIQNNFVYGFKDDRASRSRGYYERVKQKEQEDGMGIDVKGDLTPKGWVFGEEKRKRGNLVRSGIPLLRILPRRSDQDQGR
jgi:hypothetical protein